MALIEFSETLEIHQKDAQKMKLADHLDYTEDNISLIIKFEHKSITSMYIHLSPFLSTKFLKLIDNHIIITFQV